MTTRVPNNDNILVIPSERAYGVDTLDGAVAVPVAVLHSRNSRSGLIPQRVVTETSTSRPGFPINRI